MSQSRILNTFLSKTFHLLLRQEERALTCGHYEDLSMREFHVIEAVVSAGGKNTMGTLSKALGITLGSLTVAVKTLEKKGYLKRQRDVADGRCVQVVPTCAGLAAEGRHRLFHQQMVQAISEVLSEEQLEVLIQSLDTLTAFFTRPPAVRLDEFDATEPPIPTDYE